MYDYIEIDYLVKKKNTERKKKELQNSPTGNRTPVFRVTGGDTNHYTIED